MSESCPQEGLEASHLTQRRLYTENIDNQTYASHSLDDWKIWDDLPTDVIDDSNLDTWIESYRRRLLQTPFPGRTGNRNRCILLSLTTIMAEQRERVITTTYPDMVRVCAADHKTVLKAVKELREAGHLLCLGYGPIISVRRRKFRGHQPKARLHRFALMQEHLVPDDESALPHDLPLPRASTGNFAHDAFGGRRGIKRTDLTVLRWLVENPGSTRCETGKAGVVSQATAYRAIERLIKHNLVTADEQGHCYAIDNASGERTEEGILMSIVQQNVLHGQMERRVENAIYPFYEAKHAIRQRENPVPGKAGSWGMPE